MVFCRVKGGISQREMPPFVMRLKINGKIVDFPMFCDEKGLAWRDGTLF